MISIYSKSVFTWLRAIIAVLLLLTIFSASLLAQIDSLSSYLNFFPLQVNNSWEYNYVLCDPFENCEANSFFESVTGDTIFNNNSYFIFNHKTIGSVENFYYRIDSTNGNIFKIYESDFNAEYRVDSLFACEGDVFLTDDYPNSKHTIEILSIRDTVINGVKMYLRETIDEFHNFSKYVSGIGKISTKAYNGIIFLNNAVINGITYDFTTGIYNKEIIESDYQLSQNFPNPFNPATTIQYQIPHSVSPLSGGAGGGLVTFKIYDTLGREVVTLVNEYQPPGSYEVKFDGSQLASGIYYYNLKSGKYYKSLKMVILK